VGSCASNDRGARTTEKALVNLVVCNGSFITNHEKHKTWYPQHFSFLNKIVLEYSPIYAKFQAASTPTITKGSRITKM
jgi:hypothetical protein